MAYRQSGSSGHQNVLEIMVCDTLDNGWWNRDISQNNLLDMRSGGHYAVVTYDGTQRTHYQDGLALASNQPSPPALQASNACCSCACALSHATPT